ncbi:hypothetical protein Tco_0609358 [Tanacetum coccineum]
MMMMIMKVMMMLLMMIMMMQDNDRETTKSDNEGDEFVHPRFTTHDKDEKEEESTDQRVHTRSYLNLRIMKKMFMLHKVNILRKKRYYVTLSPVNPEGHQQSSLVSSGFIYNMLNPNPDIGIDSILNTESTYIIEIPVTSVADTTPSFATTLPPPPFLSFNNELKHHFPYQQLLRVPLFRTFQTSVLYSDRGSKRRRTGKEPESASAPREKTSTTTGKSIEGSKSHQQSEGQSALAEVPMHIVDDFEDPTHQEEATKTRQEDPRESFDELMDTPLDFSSFMMNRLKVDTLTPELLSGPTFELMKGTCKSLRYPHDMRKPLPMIFNSRGRQVIPFAHFINNDLAYLSGSVSSRTYSTSVTKTKAADYGNIKWIEDLVPSSIWSEVPVSYDKIIAITKLQIVEWHGYKHLDWITIRRADDKLYSFKEGDFKRLRLQDIEDMLILLVQGKLTNLKVKEFLTFSVALRMFTRSIVIQRLVKDLQFGVESYQKKLNITKSDIYRSDLRLQRETKKEAYTSRLLNPKRIHLTE